MVIGRNGHIGVVHVQNHAILARNHVTAHAPNHAPYMEARFALVTRLKQGCVIGTLVKVRFVFVPTFKCVNYILKQAGVLCIYCHFLL